MPAVFLKDRLLLRVDGSDAESFLQNLITTDLGALAAGEARPGALLTPQGKILFDFMIWREGDGFLIETSAEQADNLIKRLTMYKLRAAVTIALEAGDGIVVVWDDDDLQGVTDSRFSKAGVTLRRRAGGEGNADLKAYDALRIRCGVPVSGKDFALQDAFPHDVLMDLNGGLSFRKGCYVGQEVVSRMQHRGTARRRVVIVASDVDLPENGTDIMAGGKPIGTLGTVVGRTGLAIVRTDRAGGAMAEGVAITTGGTLVSLSLPAWSGLQFPSGSDEATA